MTKARLRTGRAAEDAAAELLERRGYRILERNARIRRSELGIGGEIDLVAIDGEALVFVEVKAGRISARRGAERPALAVGPRKRARLRRLARGWLAMRSPGERFAAIRFDVVGVSFDTNGRIVDLEWIRDAF